MATMLQLEKLEGVANVQMIEVEIPTPGPAEVLVKVERSLISRGSEIFRRYVRQEAIDPVSMGYSDAGTVQAVGSEVSAFTPGDRVMVSGPHAQYVCRPQERCFPLPDELPTATATFLPLANGALTWSTETPVEPGDTVVVLGQGLVGNMYAQAVRERDPGGVIVVDATAKRCQIATACGAATVINAAETDPVADVLEATGGAGAEVVVECVGGNAGVVAFTQAQQMTRPMGVLHVISKYTDGDGVAGSGIIPLDTTIMQSRRVVIGHFAITSYNDYLGQTARMLLDRRIDVEPLITHRLPWEQTVDAYHLLFNSPDEALGVILEWD